MAVKDDKYATVAVVTNGTDVGGKMVVVDLMTKNIVKEVDLVGEPDCKLFRNAMCTCSICFSLDW